MANEQTNKLIGHVFSIAMDDSHTAKQRSNALDRYSNNYLHAIFKQHLKSSSQMFYYGYIRPSHYWRWSYRFSLWD